jgi:organic hydroperoxide reductase OsmC/OhrA
MSTYYAEVIWYRGDQKFSDNRYSRAHTLKFDGGIEVPGSSSPHVVPLPYSKLEAIDPEEAFVSSLSSCHMLWFLSIAAKHGFIVDEYHDCAEGVMGKNASGKLVITTVTLKPLVSFWGDHIPSTTELSALHHEAHNECFIANSVNTEICCEPRFV